MRSAWHLGLRWLVFGGRGAVTWRGFWGRSFGGGGCFRWSFTTVPFSASEVAVLGGGSVAVELLLELAPLDYVGLRPLPEVPGRRRTAVAAGPSLLAEEGSHHWGSRIRLSRSAVSGGHSDSEGVVAVRRRVYSCRPVRLGRWPSLGLGRRRHLRRGGLISPGTSRRSRGNLMDSLAGPSVRGGAAPVWGAVRRRAGGAGSLVGDG